MRLGNQAPKTLRCLLLGLLLTACSEDADGQEVVASPGQPSLSQLADAGRGLAEPPSESGDVGSSGLVDGGSSVALDAGATPLAPSFALGANPGDPCSPSGEGTFPWARCETQRGLRCVLPPPRKLDAPSTCACPEGATFEHGACVAGIDASVVGDADGDAGQETLKPSTALGAKPGDRCGPNAFNLPWALCDARRHLECALPSSDPRKPDVSRVCSCPQGTSYAEGVCATTRP